jgi:hypothetical protein
MAADQAGTTEHNDPAEIGDKVGVDVADRGVHRNRS